ncbi:lipid A deacylase LpxR family protein [Chitinophaga sp. HK235]|uniref:lipid A deacylase LpxR family protein n=1 Tax=Chitinophaga sp. HK235 TaxID=2952571 RepID=UPI001BAB0121|nr:lipid A deacylase LpxR family protein [Chitinophaga sp. HK235]
MKRFLCGIYIFLSTLTIAQAQITQNATRLLRVHEDDDFFSFWGRGTDRAYSNGTGFGYVYMKRKKSTFIDKWIFPTAGPNSINVFEWDGMQLMFTPDDLSDSHFIPGDFYYSAAVVATHGLTSYNPVKKYRIHSELVFGIMGPWALGEQAQIFVHNLLGDQPPRGWANQLPNAPLLNYNISYERMLWNPRPSLEVIGGFSARAGTMVDAVSTWGYARFGLINPYFGDPDLHTATRRKFQIYLMARPQFSITAYNALLQGGLFRSSDADFEEHRKLQTSHMNPFIIGMDYGFAIGIGRTTISYTQQTSSPWMSTTRKHSFGNITLLIPISKATHFP